MKIRFISLLLISFSLLTPAAIALEVPLLTWERGRVQQVVLGGGAYANKWKVSMEGNGANPVIFSSSTRNSAGYIVYSAEIPRNQPLGAYSIITYAEGSPKTVVAGVSLVQTQTRTATSSFLDLSLIIALFSLLTSILLTLRSPKYKFFKFQQSQELPDPILSNDSKFRLMNGPQVLRRNTLIELRKSVFSFLLSQEGELIYRISRPLYGFMPIIGLIAGSIAGIEIQRNGGIAATGLGVFVGVLLLSILDPLTGIFASLSFWAIQLFAGEISSIRDVLIIFAVTLSWLGSPLISSLVSYSLNSKKSASKNALVDFEDFSNSVISALIGASTFYLGSLLVNSLIYNEAPQRAINYSIMLIIFVSLIARRILDVFVLQYPSNLTIEQRTFEVVRVSSPTTAAFINLVAFGFVYIWSESAIKALFVSVLFSIPYYLAFLSFKKGFQFKFDRNLILEPVLVAMLTLFIFGQVSNRPLLADQVTGIVLVLTAIPTILHAIYSATYSRSDS